MNHIRSYRGSKENLRRRNIAFNSMARRVAVHLNTLIANNPRPIQVYSFARLAQDLGLTTDEVRSAISNGGYNGITFGVNDEDRKALDQFKSALPE